MSAPDIESAVVGFIEDDEPIGQPLPIEYPCIQCGGEVGDPLTEKCEACLEANAQARADSVARQIAAIGRKR